MVGVLDQINRETISGWIFGSIDLLQVQIDGRPLPKAEIKSVQRQDVIEAHPGRPCCGFEISSPLGILDGGLHEVSLSVDGMRLGNCPKKFRYVDKRILFIHTPKTGGSSVNDALRHHKSWLGKDHIEALQFSQVVELVGEAQSDAIPRAAANSIEKKFIKHNRLESNIRWLSGHVSPRSAHMLINKFTGANFIKNMAIKEFTNPYNYSFNKAIKNYDVVGCARDPINYLISHLNWYVQIYEGRDPNFFMSII